MPKAHLEKLPRTIWLEADAADGVFGVYLVDQTRLPLQGDILCCRTLDAVQTAIQSLAVRGAPALGVAAAMALALWAVNESEHEEVAAFLADLHQAAARIVATRPTAVNLSWGAARLVQHAHELVDASLTATTGDSGSATAAGGLSDVERLAATDGTGKSARPATTGDSGSATAAGGLSDAERLAYLRQGLIAFAREMAACDERTNRALGAQGAALLKPDSQVLTICNTGSLATAFFGTALGVVYTAYEQDKVRHVWVCETRPLNQGGRLTLWELMTCGIPATLIADHMAASCMAKGLVSCVLVGADRICANGDTANKVGTLSLAILAAHYGLPFYVVAPRSSIDPTLACGTGIPIEQRDPRELAGFTASGVILPADDEQVRALDLLTAKGTGALSLKGGEGLLLSRKGAAYAFDAWFATTPPNASIYNPAFDVTPAALITAIVTEDALHRPPYHFA
jgi:methylthioribose-1-phosphate isomerase